MAYDVIIKNGTVIDGTGAPSFVGDVAISGDKIAAVGDVDGKAKRTIDADGLLVTPGFVDIHTHLDAQIFWDPIATSSCWHGVTSVVMGNCGVTFAPCKPSDRDYLARLMESVEDVPAKSINSGLSWNWETYGDYLRALDGIPKGINAGGLVGHCALRLYAMGEQALENKPATSDEIAAMRQGVSEAVSAGALGFSTSRTPGHRTPDGDPVPGTYALPEELKGICVALGKLGKGVVECAAGFRVGVADPATRENGCLEALRGSHRLGRLEFKKKPWGQRYTTRAGIHERFKDPRVREALTLAVDFEWENRVLRFGLLDRALSNFSGGAIARSARITRRG